VAVVDDGDRVMEHRRGEVGLTVLDRASRPVTGRDVVIEQRRHAFGFGNIGFDFVAAVGGAEPPGTAAIEGFGGSSRLALDQLSALWLNLFNTATLPFYWGRYEPRRGATDAERLTRTARWLAGQGVTVKGHPLVWHTSQPTWLLDLPADEVETLLRQRTSSLVAGFAGTIDVWDAINESVILPVFANGDNAITRLAAERGRQYMIRLAFEEARLANPSATLLINDFDLGGAYEQVLQEALGAGVSIDAIGLQTHMHQGYRGEERILEAVDRFARFGLPIHLTENTFVSGDLMPPGIEDLNDYQIPDWPTTPDGEARQAADIVAHYRSLVGHPAVASITYWGLTDEGSWLGAPTGLIRKDGTRKPAYDALEGLIKNEWWMPPTTRRAEADGRLTVSGFLGDYAVITDDGEASFAVAPGRTDLTVQLT
jgi:GH35 family endo-1,4-beta-xylanase